jgi:hypothetical protein
MTALYGRRGGGGKAGRKALPKSSADVEIGDACEINPEALQLYSSTAA